VKVAEKDEVKQPSFMREGRGKSVWHKTGVRIVLGLSGMVLIGALAVQVADP